MGYPHELLSDDETIVREFRPHWFLLVVPILWTVLAVAVYVAAVVFLDIGWLETAIGVVFLIGLVPFALVPVIRWFFTEYLLTSERLILRTGVFAKSGIEIPLEKINNVIFEQNILERLFGSGDLLIESAGETGQSRFEDIPDPQEFQAVLYRTREERSKAMQGVSTSPPDKTEQLERLAKLHREGVLTDEEFAAKKKSLLDQI